ncbi:uncharacterized protein LOC125837598 [Solanum verrucosum]|uniref:uncharacterized protein LOC125837598 n=1 Tax=Solanum verrucosum TaxID=315347 RepID=UPI0020D18239|nr:uncharacterized protein LOC125837598 [Solanum verrucosum]
MPSEVEIVGEQDTYEIEVTGESNNATEKKIEVTQKVVPMPRPPPPFPQRLVKFMKDLGTKKRAISFVNNQTLQHCSAIFTRSLVQKKEDLGAFTIPCTIGIFHFAKALCDLRASINLMLLSIYKKLGLRAPKQTAMRLLMADRTVKKPIGRPFLATGYALVDMERGQMKFRLNNEEVTFNICRSMKQESDLKFVSVVHHIME